MSIRPKRMVVGAAGTLLAKNFGARLLAAGVDWTALGALVREEAARRAAAAAQGLLRGGAAGARKATVRRVRVVPAADGMNTDHGRVAAPAKPVRRASKTAAGGGNAAGAAAKRAVRVPKKSTRNAKRGGE
jgi:hypothetical protein